MNTLAIKYIIRITSVILFTLTSFSFGVDFNVSLAGTQTSVGEDFLVKVEVINASERPKLISSDFVLRGTAGISQSLEIVNGKTTKKTVYPFYLNSTKVGEAVLYVQVGDAKKGPFKIKVTSAPVSKKKPVNTGKSQAVPQRGIDSFFGRPSVSFAAEDAFIVNQITKRSVYVGEPTVVNTVLYYKVGIADINFVKKAEPRGFFLENIKVAQSGRSSEVFEGIKYERRVVLSRVLIPQKSGKLSLEGEVFRVARRGNFFSNPARDYTVKPLSINVKGLPEYQGTGSLSSLVVGSVKLSMDPEKAVVKAHEPVTVKLKITGTGDVKAATLPKLKKYKNINVRYGLESSDVKASELGFSGYKQVELVIIPSKQGTYLLETEPVIAFNPKTKRYKKLIGKINLVVKKNRDVSSSVMWVGDDAKESNLDKLNSSLKFILPVRTKESSLRYFLPVGAILFLMLAFGGIKIVPKLKKRSAGSFNEVCSQLLSKYKSGNKPGSVVFEEDVRQWEEEINKELMRSAQMINPHDPERVIRDWTRVLKKDPSEVGDQYRVALLTEKSVLEKMRYGNIEGGFSLQDSVKKVLESNGKSGTV